MAAGLGMYRVLPGWRLLFCHGCWFAMPFRRDIRVCPGHRMGLRPALIGDTGFRRIVYRGLRGREVCPSF